MTLTALLSIAIAGVVLGLASALHCAAMCGGLSLGLLSLFRGGSRNDDGLWARLAPLLLMQAGRVTAYAVLGSLAGLTGAALVGLALDPRMAARLLQWAAAASMMWIGLSVAGLVPELAFPAGVTTRVNRVAEDLMRPLRRHAVLGPYAAGLSWGICPCPMVHGALFTSVLTGSVTGGALMMAAFGLGTIPAVVASALGLSTLRTLALSTGARVALGLLIALAGMALVAIKLPAGAFCLT